MELNKPKVTKKQKREKSEKFELEKLEVAKRKLELIERRLEAKERKLEEKERKVLTKLEENEKRAKAKLEEKERKTQAKLEEKERKAQEKLAKDNEKKVEEEKKQKASQKFMQFFVAKKSDNKANVSTDQLSNSIFKPFILKNGMKLAPVHRQYWTSKQREQFLDWFQRQDLQELYLNELKKRSSTKLIFGKKTLSENSDFDIDIIEEDYEDTKNIIPIENENITCYKAKLLQFDKSRRPAFFGTFRKRSKIIKGKQPFSRDLNLFDYDLDSEEEWCAAEDTEIGEQLPESDHEEDKEPVDNYEVDNKFLVPHGYLSDDENVDKEKISNKELEELEDEFQSDIKSVTKKLKPSLCGIFWQGSELIDNQKIPKILLKNRVMININLLNNFPKYNFKKKD